MDENLEAVTAKIEERTKGTLRSLTKVVKKEIPAFEAERTEPLRLDCCHQCRSTSKKLRACTRCHCAVYCSVECQRLHWSFHRLHCVAPSKSGAEKKQPILERPSAAEPTAQLVAKPAPKSPEQ